MKRVFLMRHAKSSHDEPTLKDHERPLNKRGQESCGVMGRFMNEQGYLPDFVLCSTAVRTRETLQRLEKEWSRIPLKTYKPLFYCAGAAPYLESIYTAHASDDAVLLVGHNPDVTEAALSLLKNSFPDLRQQIHHKYPTGALLALDFEVETWADIEKISPVNAVFVTPKSLKSEG